MHDYFQSLIANCASVWRPIPGYEGRYEASSSGDIKSLKRTKACGHSGRTTLPVQERILSQAISKKSGHAFVSLSNGAHGKSTTVHGLVWAAHMGARGQGMDIDHINGVASDNRIENLRVVTHRENSINSTRPRGANSRRGVSYLPSRKGHKKWVAYITESGWSRKKKQIGYFLTEDEAISARVAAEENAWGTMAPSKVRK